MRCTLLTAALAAAAILVVWHLWPAAPVVGQGPPRPANLPGAKPANSFVGVASCASMACHHGNGPPGSAGSEYTTWVTKDPHARACEVLFSERSQRMSRLLKRPAAHQDSLCLNCHVQQQYAAQTYSPRFARQDGVGCEACHGPAQRWLAEHVSWGKRDVAYKVARGMRDTWSLPSRARLCVDCHVGSAASEVNHDLIAAGHPRLKFEFGAYHAVWPRHWSDARDKDPARGGRRDFEAEAWRVGQVESARAALELLAARTQSGAGRVWPEFAEYDCFACHHDLKAESWRQQRDLNAAGKTGRPPGSYPWGTWYFTMPRVLAARSGPQGEPLLARLKALEDKMGEPFPDQQEVRQLTAGALAELTKWHAKPQKASDLFTALVGEDGRLPLDNWDASAQFYLGLAALCNAWKDEAPDQAPKSLLPALRDVGKQLRFPPGYEGPRDDFTPRVFSNRLRAVREVLGLK
jgi:hypothetical protein